jgi:hypothetical protein
MKHSYKVTPLPYMGIGSVCTPPAENSNPSGVALAGADGQGVCAQFVTVTVPSSHVLTLAVLQFRRDWPLLAGRLSAMRAAA